MKRLLAAPRRVLAVGALAAGAVLVAAGFGYAAVDDSATGSVHLCVKDDGQVRVSKVCKTQEPGSLDLVLYDYQRLVNEEARQDVQRIDGLIATTKDDISGLGLQFKEGMDAMEATMLVMAELNQDDREDIKALLEEMQRVNQQHAAIREAIAEMRAVTARIDTDGDGLPDLEDDCPTEPSSKPDGCP